MRAVVLARHGGPEVLAAGEYPTPALVQDTDVLVRVRAAGVSPIDAAQRAAGLGYPIRLPAVIGLEGAGVVERVASAVARFAPGDPVYFFRPAFGDLSGTYAELAVVPEHCLARKPEALSFVEAAAAPTSLLAAWEALFERARLGAGQQVLVHGGAGGVGHIALQLARHAGARPCTTVSTPEKGAFAEALWAEDVIYYREENFALALLDWTDEAGVALVFDPIGGETFEHSFTAAAFGGEVVTLQRPDPGTNWTVARQRNLRVCFEHVLAPAYLGMVEAQRRQTRILERAATLFDRGVLRVHVGRSFPLAEAAAAHQALADPGRLGRVALTLS